MATAVTCRPAVLQGLARLRSAGWTIGIGTNGASDIQRTKLTAAGLADLVDGVAVSGDLEIRKPDRRLVRFLYDRSSEVKATNAAVDAAVALVDHYFWGVRREAVFCQESLVTLP
ncbi:HAD family hydrolase [Streptomyces albireticuli]|uniref:HAD family hydrolase n=1 Tax=Streptomyces albireticuli TaxID=1940 RepID=UPI001E428C54|nr:HAD hydrolase-like protein [Streptomyces albireticuli]MCD9146035.1 HAD hydrolase-like protein [Streptomyces albireticuli]MCD9165816.1 HAD hydrolase-like protein [Streptomyces albireticuli]MCD9196033.1 HAD hydrolase-like protein [Streptomyces albireticuli]